MTPPATRADDCESLLHIIADGPTEGMTIDQIQEARPSWATFHISALLWDVNRQVGSEKVRVRNKKITRYFLKRS